MVQKKETSLNDIGDTLACMVERMATKDDLKDFITKADAKRFATKDDIGMVMEHIGELRERVKSVEDGQDEILETLRPMSRAHDIDSLAVIDHERRIVRLEAVVSA